MTGIIEQIDRTSAFAQAIDRAHQRAAINGFDQHVIKIDGEYVVIDEAAYGGLPEALIDQVLHTAIGGLSGLY